MIDMLNGTYYMFDCLDGSLQERLIQATCFKGDKNAIELAEKFEATLLKVSYINNVEQWSKVIYDPYNLFNVK